jgi:predicted nucleotidyltransferase
MFLTDEEKKQLSEAIARMPEVKFAYLYGSYATGLANENSDIDIAIVLKEHAAPVNSLMTEINVSLKLEEVINSNKEIEVRFVNDAPIYFLNEAVTKGIPLFSSSEQERNEFEARVMMEYLDFKPVIDLYNSYRQQRIKRGEFGVKYRRRNPATG